MGSIFDCYLFAKFGGWGFPTAPVQAGGFDYIQIHISWGLLCLAAQYEPKVMRRVNLDGSR